jgi:CheY-like chemotaxis protein
MKKKILVVDDEKDIRESIAEILELAGYESATANNGREAVEAAIRQKPSLIICDIMMPELDGYGVVHLLQKNPFTRDIPFIFLSAKADKTDFRKGLRMGADDYLTKPCDSSELLHAVELRLEKAGKSANLTSPATDPGTPLAVIKSGDDSLQRYLQDNYDVRTMPRKSTIYQAGQRPRSVYYLLNGKIKTVKIHPDGKEYITRVAKSGELFGYSAVLEDMNYDDSAVVLEDAEIIQLPRKDFLFLIQEDPVMMQNLLRTLTHEGRANEERMINLAYSSLRKRIASALIDLNRKFNPTQNEHVILNITREDVARYVGTATESLIRTITEFRDEKMLELDKEGKIKLINVEKLKKLLQ